MQDIACELGENGTKAAPPIWLPPFNCSAFSCGRPDEHDDRDSVFTTYVCLTIPSMGANFSTSLNSGRRAGRDFQKHELERLGADSADQPATLVAPRNKHCHEGPSTIWDAISLRRMPAGSVGLEYALLVGSGVEYSVALTLHVYLVSVHVPKPLLADRWAFVG